MEGSTSRLIRLESFKIRSYEIDPRGVATFQSVCNFLQEAAGTHARELGVSVEQLLDIGLTWVLSRLRVEIDAYPALTEMVVIETWPAEINKLYAIRDFRLRTAGEAQIGAATSAWLLIDMERKRPARLPEHIRKFHPDEPVRALALGFEPLAKVDQPEFEKSFAVRMSDLDLNNHVNNTCYIEWALESLPRAFQMAHQITAFEIQFLAEGVYGDTVMAQAQQADSPQTYVHGLFRASDGRELARAVSTWGAR